MSHRCTDCHAELAPGLDPTTWEYPRCPNCGSRARAIEASGKIHGSSSALAVGYVNYHSALLAESKRLSTEGEPSLAIIVGCTACEVLAGHAMERGFAKRNAKDLQKILHSKHYGFDNDRTRDLYNLFYKDRIQGYGFWNDYKELNKLRDNCVHSEVKATQEEAEKGVSAAEALIRHVEKRVFE